MRTGPRNPFLADSESPIAHGRCDQQDNSAITGPAGPTEILTTDDVQHAWIGPGHFGSLISGRYPDGERVIWSKGREQIAKLDYETLEVLATLPVGDRPVAAIDDLRRGIAGLDDLRGQEALDYAIVLAMQYMTGVDGVYALLDHEHTLFLGRKTDAVAYAETHPTNRSSPIVEQARWDKPEHIEGFFVGDQAVKIHPAEAAQALHADDFAGAVPRPRAHGGFAQFSERIQRMLGYSLYARWVPSTVATPSA
jgi:hypothetical protein